MGIAYAKLVENVAINCKFKPEIRAFAQHECSGQNTQQIHTQTQRKQTHTHTHMYTHIYTVIAMRISLQIYANVLRQMPHKSAWKLSCGKTRRIATHQNKTKQNKTKLEQSKTKLWKLILPTITTTTTTSTTTTANVSPRHKTQLFWQASNRLHEQKDGHDEVVVAHYEHDKAE